MVDCSSAVSRRARLSSGSTGVLTCKLAVLGSPEASLMTPSRSFELAPVRTTPVTRASASHPSHPSRPTGEVASTRWSVAVACAYPADERRRRPFRGHSRKGQAQLSSSVKLGGCGTRHERAVIQPPIPSGPRKTALVTYYRNDLARAHHQASASTPTCAPRAFFNCSSPFVNEAGSSSSSAVGAVC